MSAALWLPARGSTARPRIPLARNIAIHPSISLSRSQHVSTAGTAACRNAKFEFLIKASDRDNPSIRKSLWSPQCAALGHCMGWHASVIRRGRSLEGQRGELRLRLVLPWMIQSSTHKRDSDTDADRPRHETRGVTDREYTGQQRGRAKYGQSARDKLALLIGPRRETRGSLPDRFRRQTFPNRQFSRLEHGPYTEDG